MKMFGVRAAIASISLALVLLIGIGVFAWQGAAQLASDSVELSRTHRVLALLATLQANALEAESAQRGHALGGDPSHVEAFTRARDGANARLAELRSTDAANAERYERLVALGALLARRFEGLGTAIELRQRGGPVAVLQWESTGEGRRLNEQLREVLAGLSQHAELERQALQRRSDGSARRAQGAAIACALAALGVAGFALWQLRQTGRSLRLARSDRVEAVGGHQRAESEWQRLFALAPDAVCVLDAELRIQRVSAGGEKLWGWTAEELIGKTAVDKVVAADQRKTEHALGQVIASGGAETWRNRWQRKDGAVIHLAWALRWSSDDANMLCVARDITETERLRLAVSRQTQTLGLAGAELKQAVARAESAEAMQAVFVSAVAQSLRPPLEAVLTTSGRLMQGATSETEMSQRQQWARVFEQADSLQEAIDDVLEYGATEAGQVVPEKEPFDVWEALNHAADAARKRAERKGLALRLDLADDLGYARGDVRRIEQVLRKLLHEAIAATDTGTVTLKARRARDGLVRIEVHDEALVPGDPAALFPAAATPAPAAPAATGATHGPAGAAATPTANVSLLLSHRLARLMGGDLQARKAAGTGRVFVLSVPADEVAGAA